MSIVPSIKSELGELILRGLATPYISESCMESTETGNHYQSVSLGDVHTQGFRTRREELLDHIAFSGKTVLDLGSNLGELSRAARARGAAIVDGFEYDSYFIELANAVNAHNSVTRVSFFERDITRAHIYEEQYDIVLAFSVFVYIRTMLDTVASTVRDILVLETHRLDGNLHDTYIEPLTKHFPYYVTLGESEWGVPHGPEVKRAVLAFAKTKSALGLVTTASAPAARD